MARIEGTGIKEASKDSQKVAQVYYGGPEAENKRRLKSFLKEFQDKSPLSGGPGGTIKIPDMVPVRKVSADGDETFERRDFFSMVKDPRNEVKVATTGDLSGTFNESDFDSYTKALGIKRPKQLPPMMIRMLKQNYQDDVRDGRYKEGQLINKAPKEDKKTIGERVANFAGSVFNTVTGTQPAAASQIPGGIPSGTQFSPSGDTSFASYRMAGGEQKQEGSGIVTPFSQTSMGKDEPRNITKFQDTSMGRKTVTVGGQEVAKRQTVASLPSNYKQTEAREFAKAKAFQQAKKNPNVKVGVDSKGQPTATAANDSGRARAQAAAFNRRMSGKSISQVKGSNRQSMRAAAAERQATFKKTGKSTVGARRAAAKKSMQARAKKRHSAFKKKRAESKARKAARNAARNRARNRTRRRGRRGRGR